MPNDGFRIRLTSHIVSSVRPEVKVKCFSAGHDNIKFSRIKPVVTPHA